MSFVQPVYISTLIIYNLLHESVLIILFACSDFTTLHSIIMDLLDAGAHIDTVNAKGLTPSAMAATGIIMNLS